MRLQHSVGMLRHGTICSDKSIRGAPMRSAPELAPNTKKGSQPKEKVARPGVRDMGERQALSHLRATLTLKCGRCDCRIADVMGIDFGLARSARKRTRGKKGGSPLRRPWAVVEFRPILRALREKLDEWVGLHHSSNQMYLAVVFVHISESIDEATHNNPSMASPSVIWDTKIEVEILTAAIGLFLGHDMMFGCQRFRPPCVINGLVEQRGRYRMAREMLMRIQRRRNGRGAKGLTALDGQLQITGRGLANLLANALAVHRSGTRYLCPGRALGLVNVAPGNGKLAN
ncbi:hypothetical protein EDB86DRAFT_2831630 [Lactarius hatsudake]|nr:hypothetical protein EDB86DRAFT_2831630 [Lactarius hatsudake]